MAQKAKAQRAQADFRRLQVQFAQIQHPIMVKCPPFGTQCSRSTALLLLKALQSALGSSIFFGRTRLLCLQAIRLQSRRSDIVWPSREQEQQATQAQVAAAAWNQEKQQCLQQVRSQLAQQQQQYEAKIATTKEPAAEKQPAVKKKPPAAVKKETMQASRRRFPPSRLPAYLLTPNLLSYCETRPRRGLLTYY